MEAKAGDYRRGTAGPCAPRRRSSSNLALVIVVLSIAVSTGTSLCLSRIGSCGGGGRRPFGQASPSRVRRGPAFGIPPNRDRPRLGLPPSFGELTRGDADVSTTITTGATMTPHVGDTKQSGGGYDFIVGTTTPDPPKPPRLEIDYDDALPPISDSTPSGEVLPLDGGFPSDDELHLLPRGTRGGYRVIRHYSVPPNGFDDDVDLLHDSYMSRHPDDEEESSSVSFSDRRRRRLEGISGDNVTLPIALTLLDPGRYPTLTRARRACRRGSILVHRGPIPIIPVGGTDTDTDTKSCAGLPSDTFVSDRCSRGRTDDRVHPGDVVGVQFNLGTYKRKRCYPNISYGKPKFDLPVIYEDDHMAVVNKPAGIGVYTSGKRISSKRRRGASRRNVRDVLPHVLTPPRRGTVGGPLRRPSAVHRLDVPTSGLLVVAKTKRAMVNLCRQFEVGKVRKTYTAIINGNVPDEESQPQPWEGQVSGDGLGTPSSSSLVGWNVVDYPLGGKPAVTHYRTVRRARSLNARDGTLSLVHLRPLTGRYHQLRRHVAWVCPRRPMVGDALYAGNLQAPHFRRGGLYLCSNRVTLDHPYYNTPEGRREWDRTDADCVVGEREDHLGDGMIQLTDDGKVVRVSVSVDLPKRFNKLLDGEEEWARMSASNCGS